MLAISCSAALRNHTIVPVSPSCCEAGPRIALTIAESAPATKPGTSVAPGAVLDVERPRPYVSRGGEKLEAALAGIDHLGEKIVERCRLLQIAKARRVRRFADADHDAIVGGPLILNVALFAIGGYLLIHILSDLSQRDLSQRTQVALSKEVVESLRHLLGPVDVAALQPVDERTRRDIHHLHLVGLFYHTIRNGFADPDAGDVVHRIVERFHVLNVHGGGHVDSGIQNHHHILPALFALAARYIGVSQLIHQHPLRFARNDGIGIHLFKHGAAILNLLPGDHLKFADLLDGALPTVGLQIADHHILRTLSLPAVRLAQHLEGFADACGEAKKDLQAASSSLFPHHARQQLLGDRLADAAVGAGD